MATVPSSDQPAAPHDWPDVAADKVVEVVGKVHDRTTGTAITASRGVVYGLLAAVLGLTALVLVCLLGHRLLVVVISEILSGFNHDRPGRANWMADIILGGVFALAGGFLLKKATSRPAD